ncbi:MAG: type secretion protein [Gemmataceae bacterium]|nr:type secretion protein [Gemmataceae bacterium]
MNPRSLPLETLYAKPDAPAAAPPAAGASLLDAVLAATPAAGAGRRTEPAGRLDQFLRETDPAEAVRLWFGAIPEKWKDDLKRRLVRALNQDVGRLDDLISVQLNAVLHHHEFQKLEAAWRGLWFLADSVPEGAHVKVRVLNASWKELVKDQERALEFDQSHLFRKVYNDEFGTPGGEPFGLLVGNYDVCHRPFPDHPTDDVATLRGISAVAAAAFAPFVTGVDPRFLELDSFTGLELPMDVGRTFEQLDYLKWRQFREAEDARFVGLVLPRVLYRRPYGDDPGRADGFEFREDTAAPDRAGYLWGNPAFALAAVTVRAFAETAWLADIRGTRPEVENGGRVVGLPAVGYGTGTGETPRSVTDAHITDVREKELTDLGFIPLCHTPGAAEAAFYTTPSAQHPKAFTDPVATANARLSAMLQYILCVSRFAHYLKVMIRDRVGSYTTPESVEDSLNKWLVGYVVANDNASPETKARYPLREGKAQVREIEGKPGAYQCSIYLRPHFQLDQVSAGIRLTTQLSTRAEA